MEKRQYLIQLKVRVSSSFAKSPASPAQVDRRRDVICCEDSSWFCNCYEKIPWLDCIFSPANIC